MTSNDFKTSGDEHIERLGDSQPFDESTDALTLPASRLATVLAVEPARAFSKHSMKLYLCLLVAFGCSMTQGFDSNTFGGCLAMPNFKATFGLETPQSQALATAIYVIGNIPGCLFAAHAADRYGRRFGMFIGSCLCIIGAITQASSSQHSALLAGRFILGFGASIVQTSGTSYASEMSNPAFRGVTAGLYPSFFSVGTMIATFLEYGLNFLPHPSPVQYRLPLALQGAPSVMVVSLVWFLPETPRWLYANNRQEEARQLLIKYHGEGNPDSKLVDLEMAEMEEVIELQGADKRWWDVRALFHTRGDRYRLFLVVCVAFFSEIDLPPTSYYFPILAKSVGITSPRTQLLLNALQTPVLFVFALIGLNFIDRVGRRKQLIWGCIGMSASVIVLTACTANHTKSPAIGGVGVAFLYVFLAIFAMSWTPNQTQYPSEILRFQTRAKGIAVLNLCLNLVKLPNTYISPIAIAAVGWKYYILYICTDALGAVAVYFFFVETKGYNLEELERIFDDPHPVRTSLRKQNVVRHGDEVLVKDPDAIV
jgi:sugar porter (SP) family MFS transporter